MRSHLLSELAQLLERLEAADISLTVDEDRTISVNVAGTLFTVPDLASRHVYALAVDLWPWT